MKITIEATPEEIKNILLTICGSQEDKSKNVIKVNGQKVI